MNLISRNLKLKYPMRTVGVFKTNLDTRSKTKTKAILDEIRQNLPESNPSFDLENCDKVLCVECLDRKERGKKCIVKKQGFKIDNLLEGGSHESFSTKNNTAPVV